MLMKQAHQLNTLEMCQFHTSTKLTDNNVTILPGQVVRM